MTSSAPLQVKRDPVFAKRTALTALVGPSGPALSPAPRFAAPALPATPRTALAAGGVRCGVAGEEGDVFGDGEMVRFP